MESCTHFRLEHRIGRRFCYFFRGKHNGQHSPARRAYCYTRRATPYCSDDVTIASKRNTFVSFSPVSPHPKYALPAGALTYQQQSTVPEPWLYVYTHTDGQTDPLDRHKFTMSIPDSEHLHVINIIRGAMAWWGCVDNTPHPLQLATVVGTVGIPSFWELFHRRTDCSRPKPRARKIVILLAILYYCRNSYMYVDRHG